MGKAAGRALIAEQVLDKHLDAPFIAENIAGMSDR